MSRRPLARRIGRHTVLFVFGLSGITFLTLTTRRFETASFVALLVVFGLAAGIPGIESLAALRRPPPPDTTSSPSPSPSSSSLPPSSSES